MTIALMMTDKDIAKRREEFATGKLSTVLKIALEDLEEREQDERFTIFMEAYHRPFYLDKTFRPARGPTCAVCMAGAVMSRTYQADPTREYDPACYDDATAHRLRAVDHARLGDFYSASMEIDRFNEEIATRVVGVCFKLGFDYLEDTWIEYETDKDVFKANMREVIKGLQKAGL